MKKFIFPLLSVAFLFLVTGCSEKFKVSAPYKNITVIYGLLDQQDTAHYIRVQKAFLDENKSAVTMATVADSNFFSHLNVRIERYNFDGTYKDSIHLNRVDLNAEGYPKQPGAFFNSPNYAYKFTNLLNPNYIYRIKTVNLSTGVVDSADAPIIEDFNTPSFYAYLIDDSAGKRTGLDFAATGSYNFFEVTGNYYPVSNFNYYGQGSPASFVQVFVRFNWVDSNMATQAKSSHYYDYDAGYQSLISNSFDYRITDLNLYTALATGMGVAPANVARLLDRSDLFIYLGTQDFSNYLQSNLTQGTGLTGSEIEPVYTNIKGQDALGLFTSRAVHTGKLTVTLNTVDSLMLNPLMSKANIKGTIYHQ